ncbi:hypothetical protein OCH239_03570 [Roseivivax halodurans JCM 10272]|uniref:YicC family protein n=1 Tax=Roseivivax halodurans JCM 10272 TaxID=1449350 RepID=X7EER4_9RHOB|nr:YicC/YloC family endoribonuclease [Roseivivax halodurans]ETX14382.1 hypothetical protein OCH239_03570 [Roseivivax halodurans JCM 10272]
MRQSMTGFATAQGASGDAGWTWEIRSVNGKGLDLRLRLPDWIEGLEPLVRSALAGRVSRGSITVSLKVSTASEAGVPALNEDVMRAVLDAAAQVETAAMDAGVSLAPSTPAQILNVRGVLEQSQNVTDTGALREAVLADLGPVLDAFVKMRAGEGEAVQAVLASQLDEIEGLVAAVRAAAADRAEEQRDRLRSQLARVMDHVEGIDEARIAQELALIAVKSDITEEIDRLKAHVAAARALLAEDGPVGRKLDFLCQEFNREANTLCSKAGSAPLTQAGLALKTVIDRMREQVQNVE